jgi:hypothetical protein
MGGQIPIVELRMASTLLDQLDVRVAHPHCIDAYEELVRRRVRHVYPLGLSVPADALNTGTVHVPGPARLGDGSI